MPRARPRAVQNYSDEFKPTAVRLSQRPGVQVKTVAVALEIHPFMLSKWRKDARDGRLRGRASKAPPTRPSAGDRAAAGTREGACTAARGARPTKKSHSVLFRSKGDTFAFIDTQRARVCVVSLCRRYGVTPAGFYAWRGRGESLHAKQDRVLSKEIARLFVQHHERYGSPRLYRLLSAAGWVVSRRRVARLMRAAGFQNSDELTRQQVVSEPRLAE